MAEQIGNNGNELTLIIPSALEKDWAVSIRDNCFSVISSHDHSGSGSGKKLIAADAIDATSAWLANDTYLLFKDNAGTSTVDVIKATTSDELQFGTTIAVADFQSDGLTVSDATDNTKKLALDLSGITTATTRTLTMPDADVNLGALTNSNIASGAAIALNKLAALTASELVITDGSGVLSSAPVATYPSLTELTYLKGVTSAIQTQLNSKQAASSNLDAIAAVATNGGLHRTGAGTYAARTLTGTASEIDVANGDGVSGDPTVGLADNPVIPGTDSMVVPKGNTSQRVSTTDGAFRFNSELSRFEGYRNSAWSEIGGGAGGINYIDDSDAEAGVGDWTTYADAASENPVDGTGGSPTITFTQNSTAALRGSNDFKFTKDAADRQGEGVGYAFSIDNADKAQKLYISFDYDASDADYADDDIRIAVYDVTNATLIRCNGEDLKGGKGKHLAWFQSAADSTSYRLIIHQSSTNATAYDVYFDNISVGPRDAVVGTSIDRSYYHIQQDGINMTDRSGEIEYALGSATINSDGNGISVEDDSANTRTKWIFNSKGNVNVFAGYRTANINDTVQLFHYNSAGTLLKTLTGTKEGVSDGRQSSSFFLKVEPQDFVTINATIGVRNTASQCIVSISHDSTAAVLMSEDIGNREIRVRGAGNAGAAITANTEAIDFTLVEDTTGSWSQVGSHGPDTFTAPESGDYSIAGGLAVTSANTSSVYAYVNGVQNKVVGKFANNGTETVNAILRLEKGDTVDFRFSGTLTLNNDTNIHWIHIQKLAQPQTLLETETVAARYTSDSGQTINNTTSIVTYEDLDKDTHNAYNTSTGVYTIPVSGWYSINARIQGTSQALAVNQQQNIYIAIDGTIVTTGRPQFGGSTVNYGSSVYDIIYLNKGQTVDIRCFTDVSDTLDVGSPSNVFSIARIK